MRIISLARVPDDHDEYVIEIECEPEVTERFTIEVNAGTVGCQVVHATCGDAAFCARVQDGMTRRDIYEIVTKFHLLRVAPPPADVQILQLGGGRFRVEGGPIAGLEVARIPKNPTPEEADRIARAGVAFIMGYPPPEE